MIWLVGWLVGLWEWRMWLMERWEESWRGWLNRQGGRDVRDDVTFAMTRLVMILLAKQR